MQDLSALEEVYSNTMNTEQPQRYRIPILKQVRELMETAKARGRELTELSVIIVGPGEIELDADVSIQLQMPVHHIDVDLSTAEHTALRLVNKTRAMAEPRTWRMWAHRSEPGKDGTGAYRHFGIRRYVQLHGLSDPIVEVELTEDPAGNYWACIKTGEDTPSMIWPSQGQFSMCFPYGPQVEVDQGKMTIVRLKVREV
jgi:hypothetical protein